ncbi:major facilitator superfamily permease [Levilactobacillus paucivorans]|uniref:Major facilitator superfamily permease n=1 Tax=Levilactobacillus paucivorans TaxID=616990 RepID=A0A0R2LVR2_9LACO|nr:multidrug efflux MFS transporter [Levilactobacillus paucivorans]KRO03979.1 major facilitator superfamily permease [Levilactobacillus paucivorans]
MGTRKKEQWRRNLAVLWLGTFIAGMGFSEIMPFLSLYVDDLGTFTKGQLTMYSGVTYAVTFFVIALVSPLWGKLADQKGRKLMLLRSSLGMAVVIGLMGFVTNIWQLIGLRFLQGFFAGYIPNASALIASETPREKSGNALGILTTGYVSGNLIGPVLGGILAQVFSIRWTFILTGIFLIIVFFLSATLVHEHFTPVSRAQQARQGSWLNQVKNPKLILVLLVSTLIIQMGNNSITPIISLYVKQLMHNVGPITLVAGIIAALPGLSTLLAAPKLGEYGDRHGTSRVLVFGYIFAVLMYFPQGFVSSVWLLGILRFMIGVSDGALFPAVQTLLTKNSPQSLTGTVFSWNQSFQALGSMFGSLFGGVVANIFNYNGVFIFTAITLLLNFGLLWWLVPEIRHFRQQHA